MDKKERFFMARPRKEVKLENQDIPQTPQIQQTQQDTNLKQENESLKSDIDILKEQIQMLTNMVMESRQTNQNQTRELNNTPSYETLPDIPLNKVVRVMSLFAGTLLLATQKGGGKIYRFNSIGDVQPIIYADLVQILSNHQKICNEGQFIILDQDVIKAHSLTQVYERILGVDQIKNILEFDEQTIEDLFNKTTESIRESIISVVVDKINGKDSVDKNKIHFLSDICGMDLFAYARGDVEKLVNSRNRF
jgi:hypothetical protein